MKKRMMLLFVSLFALTPALLGSAWGVENRSKQPEKQECALMAAKRLRAQEQAIFAPVEQNKSGKTSAQ